MRKVIVAVLLLAGAFSLRGQEARVIALRPDDAAHAKKVWEELQVAQANWSSILDGTKRRYIVVPEGDADAGNTVMMEGIASANSGCAKFLGSGLVQPAACGDEKHDPYKYYRKGFEQGFQFSSDFKYIVPKAAEPQLQQGCYPPNCLWKFSTTPVMTY